MENIPKGKSMNTMKKYLGWERRYHRDNVIGGNKKQIFSVKSK